MQFDIIVKDSVAAPKTGWVFSTLVYDLNAPGDAWDKMVPLGAQWGNDPGIDPETNPAAKRRRTGSTRPRRSTRRRRWAGADGSPVPTMGRATTSRWVSR